MEKLKMVSMQTYCWLKPRSRVLFSVLLFLGFLSGCRTFKPYVPDLKQKNDGLYLINFQHIQQKEPYDCGEGALAIVLTYWAKPQTPEEILKGIFKTKSPNLGTTAQDLADYARNQGLEAFLIRTEMKDIFSHIRKGRPLIVCRRVLAGVSHYEVVVGYEENPQRVIIANPAGSVVSCSWDKFRKLHDQTEKFTLLIIPKEVEIKK